MALDKDALVGFLAKDLKLDVSSIEDATPLFSSGLIDSFMLVSLMSFVEKAGSIKISPSEVTLDNLDTIGRILIYAAKKRAG